MNRRPSKSRSGYDAFSSWRSDDFRAASPDAAFFDEKKTPHPGRRTALILFFALVMLLAVNLIVNQFVFPVRVSIPVKGLDEVFEGFTILQISDLKGALFGKDQRRIRRVLQDEAFDVILLTGDMVSALGNAQPLYSLVEMLRALAPQTPLYFIPGDDDPAPASMEHASGGSPFAPWVLGVQQRGAQQLTAPVSFTRGGQRVWLTASTQLTLDVDAMQAQYEQQYLQALSSGDENAIELASSFLRQFESLRAARKEIADEDIIIGAAHTPPTENDLRAYAGKLDVLLCGHTLGGLIRLPFAGALFIPSRDLPRYGLLPGPKAGSGLSDTRNPRVYTSSGLGSTDRHYPSFFFRLFNPPTVSLISLSPSTM